MPAMLDDPTAPVIYRTSGAPPYPTPSDPQPALNIAPRQVTLRDRITIASLLPFSNPGHVPPTLLAYLCEQLNREIEKGDTYPMISPMPPSSFGAYWFQNFAAVMLLGEIHSVEEVADLERRGTDWSQVCLGSFYIKPNYPGRSSHVCNGGFLVTEVARNKGVGRLMGEGYLEWAPKLVCSSSNLSIALQRFTQIFQNYTYSVFNLVYETNVASCRIWDALGFKRIGRVKSAGNLRSYPNELVDAIIYGRDLGPEGEDFVSEERFDKIRYYLKHGKYPDGADRAEKSRLRSAATHYKLLPAEDGSDKERLMLKDKEVVADQQRQYEIAREVHAQHHGGINKTTATIAEKYHWVRIKETTNLAIKNCPDCKESNKVPTVRPEGTASKKMNGSHDPNSMIERLVNFDDIAQPDLRSNRQYTSPSSAARQLPPSLSRSPPAPIAQMHNYDGMPLDPQIMEGVQLHSGPPLTSPYHHHSHPPTNDGAYDLGMQHPDTRLATDEHIQQHDEPMGYRSGSGDPGLDGELMGLDGRTRGVDGNGWGDGSGGANGVRWGGDAGREGMVGGEHEGDLDLVGGFDGETGRGEGGYGA
ncbi:hypothetical protein MMC12_007150 [Toensbergia leucococca]|nr:hypothetical protein [Toensbergia leucococca]